MSDDAATITLKSKEGESFTVPLEVARMSVLIKSTIDEDDDADDIPEVPLPNVKAAVLKKVIEFCT
eukprot:CAMPEP_0178954758 /NCGR_PEP_ID=MMETSP0789-20121207/9187_1 /TAXON_ID=3005 /ORGANISM="Rhizosolenia setigera, Strain CCMP 1694" /LENGTH=65 /DNA_ID=CAMNT_0020636233 /DNA_START=38 /DNA_END=231 /DNA_ORIENTATION=+